MSLSTDDINSVLYYSYIPDCECAIPDDIEAAASGAFSPDDYETLVAAGREALDNAFDAIIEEIDSDRDHVVPLTSGLDSRTILGHLLDHPDVDDGDIHTITLGSPGTFDFEYGQHVATSIGVRNETIDLQSAEFDWSLDGLRGFAASDEYRSPGRVFGKYMLSKLFERAADDAVFWSGFMGDPTAGSHLPEQARDTWGDAVDWYTQWERQTNYQGLVIPEWDPASVLPDAPYLPKRRLWYEVQLDFAHRQQCFIRETVQADRCQTPYTQPEWLAFILTVPYPYREGRRLFRDILKTKFPELAAIPSDANGGLPLTASRPRQQLRGVKNALARHLFVRLSAIVGTDYNPPYMSYLDFESELRTGGRLYPAADQLIHEFAQRDVAGWFDPHDIWREHQSGRDLASEIRAICSLELSLQ